MDKAYLSVLFICSYYIFVCAKVIGFFIDLKEINNMIHYFLLLFDIFRSWWGLNWRAAWIFSEVTYSVGLFIKRSFNFLLKICWQHSITIALLWHSFIHCGSFIFILFDLKIRWNEIVFQFCWLFQYITFHTEKRHGLNLCFWGCSCVATLR